MHSRNNSTSKAGGGKSSGNNVTFNIPQPPMSRHTSMESNASWSTYDSDNSDETDAKIPWGAVIYFSVSSVSCNLKNPWKTEDPQRWHGTGFYIGNKRIITNHHVIDNATSIRLERNGQPGNFPARVISKSSLCDLGLVTVDDESFWSNMPEIEFDSHIPRPGDSILALGYPLDATTVTGPSLTHSLSHSLTHHSIFPVK